MLLAWAALGIWIKVAIVASVVAVIGGGIWFIHHTVWKNGYVAAEAELKPKIVKLEGTVKNLDSDLQHALTENQEFQRKLQDLTTAYEMQSLLVDDYKARTLAAEIRVRKALLEVAAKEKQYTAQIARLTAIAAGPALTEGACEEADAILRSLARDRMRNHTT
jgi:hypothetical protein